MSRMMRPSAPVILRGQRFKKFLSDDLAYAAKTEAAARQRSALRRMAAYPIYRTPAAAFMRPDEVRTLDVPQTTTTLSAVPIGIPLNVCQSGTAIWQRDGNIINMKSLKLRGQIVNIATTVQSSMRILVVYDNMNNGTIPPITTILQNIDQNGAATTGVFTELSPMQRDRFKIIRDIQVLLPSVTNTAGVLTNDFILESTQDFSVNTYMKLGGLQAFFSSNSTPAVIGDLTKGGLFLFVIGLNTNWNFVWNSRLRFRK